MPAPESPRPQGQLSPSHEPCRRCASLSHRLELEEERSRGGRIAALLVVAAWLGTILTMLAMRVH